MNLIAILSVFQFGLTGAYALTSEQPDCLDKEGHALPLMDNQVLEWKTTTPNQFLARARVSGKISDIFPDHSGHQHFSIQLGDGSKSDLEVVYNVEFGALPKVSIGMEVEACGDYITSNASTSQYPASPAGAIIHWVHRNPDHQGHASGYLVINHELYGQGSGKEK